MTFGFNSNLYNLESFLRDCGLTTARSPEGITYDAETGNISIDEGTELPDTDVIIVRDNKSPKAPPVALCVRLLQNPQ